MSFLPAEELDDFDSDDGFTGDEDFLQAYLNKENFKSADEKSSPHKRTDVRSNLNPSEVTRNVVTSSSSPPIKNAPRRQFGAQNGAERNGFNSNFQSPGQVFYTEEDFKMAAIKGNIELVTKCLNQGIAVNQPLRNGWTALMYASNNAKPAIIEFLLGVGADANCHTDLYTTLMCACSATLHSEEDVLACAQLLINAGADVNAKDRYHSTPLMLASKAGKLETVKLLLENGANVNAQDSSGWTALTMATQKSHKTIVMALLDAGADCNIRHRDKLTVKDLAAHLPTDEMLALLERRPFISSDYGDEVTSSPLKNGPNHCLLDSGDASMKSTDLRYGELELFLYGLDLPHLLPLFRKQLIDLQLLLTLTEEDLMHAGVEQLGARKKILDATHAVHKRNWEASSLVSIHFNKCISCADAVAMMANVSKHIRYIASTTTYVREQIKRQPEIVMQPTDRVNPTQLVRHVEDTMKNVSTLRGQLTNLQTQLTKVMSHQNTKPADLITYEGEKKSVNERLKSFSILCIAFGTLCVFFWKRHKIFEFIK